MLSSFKKIKSLTLPKVSPQKLAGPQWMTTPQIPMFQGKHMFLALFQLWRQSQAVSSKWMTKTREILPKKSS
jgi:hypothetical protein